MSRHFDTAVDLSVIALRENEGHPLGAWSTGEQLLVALVLMDREHLTEAGYTYSEAMDWVAGGIGVLRTRLPGWLDLARELVDQTVEVRGV